MNGAALHKPWSDPARQREGYRFGMWLFLTSEALFFGALFFTYLIFRYLYPVEVARAAAETNAFIGIANTAILLASSCAIALGERLLEARSAKGAAFATWLALSLGAAFLVLKALEYHEDLAKHLWPGASFALSTSGANLFWGFYWVATGVHAIHVVIGLGLFVRLLHIEREGFHLRVASVRATALYWHFVDIIWVMLFPILYLVGRG